MVAFSLPSSSGAWQPVRTVIEHCSIPIERRSTKGPAMTSQAPGHLTLTGPRHLATPAATHRWWALAALCLSVLLVGIDNTIVNVALPTIGRELSAGISDLQWV